MGTDMRPFLLVHKAPGNGVVSIRFCEIVRAEQIEATLVITTSDGASTTISSKEMQDFKKHLIKHSFSAENKPIQQP